MQTILGIDLGSHSLGWAIREISTKENQFTDYGVLTFEKGVGEGKSGEFPLVKKRTESRSKRRNYQAEKYRKWALLETLITAGMCPLRIEELDEWRKYKKGSGRKYPQSERFIQWLRFDFDGDGKTDFEALGFDKHESHYLFRMLAASEKEDHKALFRRHPEMLGRVFYHLVQRRGFRGREEEEAKTIMEGTKDHATRGVNEIRSLIDQHKTLGSALYYLQKNTKERIRKRYNLRTDYEDELNVVCRQQGIKVDSALYKQLYKAIIWQRPLRSQKGLVGYCTFEAPVKNEHKLFIRAGKKRCPVSHPFYEEYRVWTFINNLKITLPESIEREEYLQDKIYPLFYNTSRDFKLSSIFKELRKVGGEVKSKFPADTKVVSCTFLNKLEKILGPDWKVRYGWQDCLHNRPKSCPYSIEDIWHVLFTSDSREKLREFATAKLGLPEDKAEEFSAIKLTQGYATLCLSAIRKIIPYLRKGFMYNQAVYLANMHTVLGIKELTPDIINAFSREFNRLKNEFDEESKLREITNSLIRDQIYSDTRFGMDPEYQLDDDDRNDILRRIVDVLGKKQWEDKTAQDQAAWLDYISRHYLHFLQKPRQAKLDSVFQKPSRFHDKLFEWLQETYSVPDKAKQSLWHPSEQETYENAPEVNGKKLLGGPQPIGNGLKNPMALKALYKLRSLINYLLETGKIDEDTKVVVEIARDLNDANMRKAIEKWQRTREKENGEIGVRIEQLCKECNLGISLVSKEMIDKYRLWQEQNQICLYTGNTINCCDLFNGNKYDFEHTIPASMSFDNELKNLTIADSVYNRNIKKKNIPFDLPNYDQDIEIDGVVYTKIKPRLRFMEEKVEQLTGLLNEWKNKSRFASTKEIKDACIQKRHLTWFELDYWRKKFDTFTCREYKAGWRNSQLKDTQIVTKYALPYLKTVFRKVEVQKGTVTADFRKIYKIQPKTEKKDRNSFSHHAMDAAVLTLIPPAVIRDQILLKYNQAEDQGLPYTYHEPVRNWAKFHINHILSIDKTVLINFQPQNRTLTPTYKHVRKRGNQQFVKEKKEDGYWQYKLDKDGGKIPLMAKGDSIRGQLHKESFFGAIRQGENICLVERYPISSFTSLNDCNHIVDKEVSRIVRSTLEERISDGKTFDEAKMEPVHFPSGKEVIRKVRCKVLAGAGYLKFEKALDVHRHDYASKYDYKQYSYAQNEENTLCLYYEGIAGGKLMRAFRIVGLYELSRLRLKTVEKIKDERYYQSIQAGRGKNKFEIPLRCILQSGMKVIVYEKNISELQALDKEQLHRRVFRIYKFNEPAPSTAYVYLQNHLEARKDDELGGGDKDLDFGKYQSRVFLGAAKFNCAIENLDFRIEIDGGIKWLF